MNRTRVLPVLALVLAVSAGYLSYKLLGKHLSGSTQSAWFEAGCSEDSSIGSNCAAVLNSPYSYWPPKHQGQPERALHIPVAFLGMVYYSTLAVWLFGVGQPSYARRRWHLLPLFVSTIGLLGSAYFVKIMLTEINEWCIWCMVTHALNALLAACLWLMWPRRAASVDDVAVGTTASDKIVPVHPSTRLLLVTLLAICLIMFGQLQFLGLSQVTKRAMAYKNGYNQCADLLKKVPVDTDVLLKRWLRTEQHVFEIRPDDPIRLLNPSAVEPLEAVVFSDFACPSCKRLAEFLDARVQPLFDGRLKLVFKHYPLNRACNPVTASSRHPHACEGAFMAEAARQIGGSAKFWQAHDFIFAQQDRLKRGGLSSADVASELAIDPIQFEEAIGSDAALERIGEDAKAGRSNGLSATPALFVSGRLVEMPARNEIGFWDKLADHYWQSRNETRPPSTRLSEPLAIPGTPSRSVVP